MMSKRIRATSIVVALALALPRMALADGIDLVPFLTKLPGNFPLYATVIGVAVLMTVNYLLNAAVIALPAVRVGPVVWRTAFVDLIFLTLLGQLADRLGAVVAFFVTVPLANYLPHPGEGGWFVLLIGVNFLTSGVAVGVLSYHFLKVRWRVPVRSARLIGVAAGVLTNPAWAMALWFR